MGGTKAAVAVADALFLAVDATLVASRQRRDARLLMRGLFRARMNSAREFLGTRMLGLLVFAAVLLAAIRAWAAAVVFVAAACALLLAALALQVRAQASGVADIERDEAEEAWRRWRRLPPLRRLAVVVAACVVALAFAAFRILVGRLWTD